MIVLWPRQRAEGNLVEPRRSFSCCSANTNMLCFTHALVHTAFSTKSYVKLVLFRPAKTKTLFVFSSSFLQNSLNFQRLSAYFVQQSFLNSKIWLFHSQLSLNKFQMLMNTALKFWLFHTSLPLFFTPVSRWCSSQAYRTNSYVINTLSWIFSCSSKIFFDMLSRIHISTPVTALSDTPLKFCCRSKNIY